MRRRMTGPLLNFAVLGTSFGVIFLAELPDKTALASLVLGTRYRPSYVFVGVAAAFATHVVLAIVAGSLLGLLPHRTVEVITAVLFAVGAVIMLRRRDDPAPGDPEETGNTGSPESPEVPEQAATQHTANQDAVTQDAANQRTVNQDAATEHAPAEHAASGDLASGDIATEHGGTAQISADPTQSPAPRTTAVPDTRQGFWRVVATSFAVLFVAEFGDLTQVAIANLAARYSEPVAVGTGAVVAMWAVGALAICGGRQLLRFVPFTWITRAGAAVMAALAALSVLAAVAD